MRSAWITLLSLTTLVPSALASPKYIFSFGEAWTSTGFVATGPAPNAANPFGNPAFPGQTTPAGLTNWLGYLTATYNKTQVLTYNYAVPESIVDKNIFRGSWTPLPSDLNDQVETFLSTIGNTPWTPSDSLFSVFSGIWDILSSFANEDPGAIADRILDAYFAQASHLYDRGARNILLVNLPPFDLTPTGRILPLTMGAKLKAYCIDYNKRFASRLPAFKAKPGVKVYFWDLYPQVTTLSTINLPFWASNGYCPSNAGASALARYVGSTVLSGFW